VQDFLTVKGEATMRRLSRTAIAAAVGLTLTAGTAAAAASQASASSYNCRQVIAYDITFFANSTGSATTSPFKLFYGERFKSLGNYDGRYLAQTRDGYWGYTTSDSRWVTQVSDMYCW
jgi:hypothetical protein